ncbi:Phenylacetone monooxygenase [Mycobacterium kansasii]|uniref:Phenylacetone monooxygenase n=3 Tax=Mycobacterium kansasii TaxID=1768 RepID=A0A653END8_MYCKA|nr:steroid monooxygenase [Mycobacterium kansasii]VAZ60025.1 Phenylacetone monooxygenase [Mycobacterium kansasii]VAZ66345.1 Phenylacetone monooxygenase [Mycobacterium kansasii]VAZ74587.1 Phenylacetone monooxygenase [Mycobacterium kansasii]VTO98360.1 Phenylacetone monooxygenase [Mycobacterium kansasii]
MMIHMADEHISNVDVVVVGAGFAGLYAAYRLRLAGQSMRIFEAGDDLGGTWYWNRYPGARVDIPSVDYMFSFDADWSKDWQWSEKYATQPEILRYLNHVADKHDLRRDMQFGTRVTQAHWDDTLSGYRVRTDRGDEIGCHYLVMATGCLSVPKDLDIPGVENFTGELYFTSSWPHEPVDFTGKRVGVVGTGSSGIQSIPLIAAQAAQLVVFQRTPCFSIPAHNGPIAPDKLAQLVDDSAYRQAAKYSFGGVPLERTSTPAFSVSADERRQRYERAWQRGELLEVLNLYTDVMSNTLANNDFAEFIRGKIRSIVRDPQTAEALCPTTYPVGAKRLCLDTNYYATFNLPHVRLVNLQDQPLVSVTETGIATAGESFEFDTIVFATGFDAITGAVAAVDIVGRDGLALKDKWRHGPSTYLGLMTEGFPNLFLIAGPHSPSVLSNMAVSIEQHLDFVADALTYLRAHGFDQIEPTKLAEAGWMRHVDDAASITLFPQANSWYVGANIPGKPRTFMAYAAGVDFYRMACDEVAAREYLGFALSGPGGAHCNDGVIRRLQPDVQMVLEQMALLDLPPMESLPPEQARALMNEMNVARPWGPDVGEIVDGSLPGAAGDLAYRLYRPASPGPNLLHPLVVYFHGGGWVLGDQTSDDPLCRDLCVRSDTLIVSVNYRHAPEHRFPAALDDGWAAVRWVAEHAEELGGIPGRLAVCGWSAGAGIAAVICQLARDTGWPAIVGQALITPVVDTDQARRSYFDNADGYGLTAPLMRWFFDHYADPEVRDDPRIAPLRAPDLSGLPPAIVVSAEFDPLRDEGDAYAEALAAAEVPVRHVRARGHTHLSLSMVDVVVSGAPIRAQIADALRGFFATDAATTVKPAGRFN